jgi:hypothetical protein
MPGPDYAIIHPTRDFTFGGSTEAPVTTALTSRLSKVYTVRANSPTIWCYAQALYRVVQSNVNIGYFAFNLYVDGVKQTGTVPGGSDLASISVAATRRDLVTASLIWDLPGIGLSPGPHTFEIRDQLIVVAGAPTVQYVGQLYKARLMLQEVFM